MVEQLQSAQDLTESIWADREQIIAELRTLLRQLEAGASQQEMAEVLHALEACRSANDIDSSPALVRWIPSLLRGRQNTADSSSAASRIPTRTQRLALATQQSRLARRLWLYPLALFVIMTSVFVFFAWAIVPAFADFMAEFGVNVPTSTQFLFDLSSLLRMCPWWVLAVTLGMVASIGMVLIFRPESLLGYHGPCDRMIASLMGLRTESKIGFCHDLADLVSAGVQPEFALRYSLQRRFGEPPRTRARKFLARLPAGFHDVVHVDHETGWTVKRVDVDGLRTWTTIYENRLLRETSQSWLSVVSVLLHVTAGFMIAYLVTAIYGPIVQLIRGLT